jgi:hypothetical protein
MTDDTKGTIKFVCAAIGFTVLIWLLGSWCFILADYLLR